MQSPLLSATTRPAILLSPCRLASTWCLGRGFQDKALGKRVGTHASCRAACTLASMESRTIDWEAQPLLLSPADRCCVPLTHCCTAPLLSFWNTILNRIALTLPYFCRATQDLEVYQPHSHCPAPVKLELSGKHSSVCSRFPLSRFTRSTPPSDYHGQ